MGNPVYLSSFVGRKHELDELKKLIRDKSTRLLTLTGPGGCGKTRLASECFTAVEDAYEDGVFWVELVALSDPLAAHQAAASALGVESAPGQTLLESLTSFLQHRESLVILDNCEHLLATCAQMTSTLLRACPALHFLATSRHKLNVEGEQIWPVPPLSYPVDRVVSHDLLLRYDAIKLFLERAKSSRPNFEIDEAIAPDLVRVNRLLEGMPLAIELAASWVNVLDVNQMADRFEDHLPRLSKSGSSEESRHHSMRETIRWSYDLLAESERRVFRRLGVFAGGFSLEAAEAVCSSAISEEENFLYLLGRLIDQSLVVRERPSNGSSRYDQLESIRQFAEEQLREMGEVRQAKDDHLAFFVKMIQETEHKLYGPDQRQWTEQLEAEFDNLQDALSWACHKAADEDGAALEQAICLAAGLFWFWSYTERSEVAKGWYERILSIPGTNQETPEYVDLIRQKAAFTWLLGDYPAAQADLQTSLRLAERYGYDHVRAQVKLLLGITARHQGHPENSISLLRESAAVFQALGDRRGAIIALTNLGGTFLQTGDPRAAHIHAELAVNNAREGQDLWGLGLSLSGLGEVQFRLGRTEDAFQRMEEALETLEHSGQQWLLAEAIWRLADMKVHQGDFVVAEKQLERCFALAQDCGALQWQIAALESLGFISLSRGNIRQAAGHFRETLRMTPRQEFVHAQLHVMVGIVHLVALKGQWEQAVTLWGAYEGLKKVHRTPDFQEEKPTRELVKTQIESPGFSQRLQEGEGKSLEEAATLAIDIADAVQEQVIAVASDYQLQLFGLGQTQVYLHDTLLVPSDWTFAKPKELLFYLASNPPKSKEQIGLAFWADATPRQLRTSLRAALYHLRKALGDRKWVRYEDGYYHFNRRMNYWYDVETFEAGLEAAQELPGSSAEQAVETLEAAVNLYRGDFLADITNDQWAVLRREELKRKYLAAMSRLGGLYIETENYLRAVEIFGLLLETDPLLEEAHRGIMRAYALLGEHGLALRQYESLVQLLREELDASPSTESTALYQSLTAPP